MSEGTALPVSAGEVATMTKLRRILIIVDGVFPSTGGAEMQARLQSRMFTAMGHEVDVIAPHISPEHARHEHLDGVPVQRISYPKIKRFGALVLCSRLALLLLFRRRRYDAVHVHTADILAAVAGIVRPLMRATLMVKISGAWEFQGGILDPALRERRFYRFLNACLRRADHIQCISEHTRRMVLDAGYADEQVTMIPNSVDLQRFVPSPPSSAVPTVVFVGRLVPVKGVNVLLDAWKLVTERAPARLIIAGDGIERAALENQSRALGLQETVEFRGNLVDVTEVLRGAAMYVQPSFQEGMPNAVLEGMACGLPIVATRVGGNEDLVKHGHNGLLVPVGDAAALADALAALICDPKRAAEMGLHSRAIVEGNYSVPSVLRRLLSAYEHGGLGEKPATP